MTQPAPTAQIRDHLTPPPLLAPSCCDSYCPTISYKLTRAWDCFLQSCCYCWPCVETAEEKSLRVAREIRAGVEAECAAEAMHGSAAIASQVVMARYIDLTQQPSNGPAAAPAGGMNQPQVIHVRAAAPRPLAPLVVNMAPLEGSNSATSPAASAAPLDQHRPPPISTEGMTPLERSSGSGSATTISPSQIQPAAPLSPPAPAAAALPPLARPIRKQPQIHWSVSMAGPPSGLMELSSTTASEQAQQQTDPATFSP